MKHTNNDNDPLVQTEIADAAELLTRSEGDDQPFVFKEIIKDSDPGKIALLLESLPLDERFSCWTQIEQNLRVDVLSEMRAEPRLDLLNKIPHNDLNEIFSDLTPEDLIEWSDSLPQAVVNHALKQMGVRQQKQFNLYNKFSDNEIGRYAEHQMLVLPYNAKIDKAYRLFTRVELDCNDSIFVVDNHNCFIGTVSKYKLLHANKELNLDAIIDDDSRAIKANLSLIDAAESIEHSNQTELPIIDDNSHIIGRLTLRNATTLVREHYESQLMAQAGLNEDDDLFAPILRGAKQRAVWLGINLLTAFLASATISLFENVLAQVVALAVLMPIVASMGGIAGSQTLTLMIRGMALGQINIGNAFSFLKNEIGIAILNGFLWALVVGFIAGYWFHDSIIGLVIGIAILVNIAVAAFSGVIIPMILQKLNQDAALSSSVILTTVTDVVGFFTFLSLATLLII